MARLSQEQIEAAKGALEEGSELPEELLRALCAEARFEAEATAEALAVPGQDPAALAQTIRDYAALIARPRAGRRTRRRTPVKPPRATRSRPTRRRPR